MSVGRFITLEGIEGAGKSTVARYVADRLTEQGITVRLTREPGGTPLAERVRQIVLERGTEQVSAVTETLLMFAARALHVENVIGPALRAGQWVVCDRFTDATRAYQGSGRGVDAALIDTLARAVHPQIAPDCTLLLDLPAAAGLLRARARSGGGADRFEAETVSFFERVRAGYLALARREPARIQVIDAAAPLGEVQQQVAGILAGLPRP
ncbi:MAG TPA: dTMP kinase [Steroidobacteraceae bacterium]|jgi:dTMP kinase|nr:dTMP kinase [Steroidobacteraceae bacterium]